MSEEKLKTKEYLVAYIDILGAKKKIIEEKEDEYLNKVKGIYDFALKQLNASQGVKDNIKVSIFSDNIIIASEPKSDISDDIHNSILNFFLFVAFFQLRALGDNFLLRGGITKGAFHINNDFVWGKALLVANELEEKIAIYPRILIDTNASLLLESIEYPFGGQKKVSTLLDEDGLTFLDYLYNAEVLLESKNKNLLDMLRTNLKNDINLHCGDSRIMEKLLWHKNYFNTFCINKGIDEFVVR